MSTAGRLTALRRSLRGTDAFLVTGMRNVRYLTGFTGSSGFALITKKESVFVTDFRYKEQSHREVEGWEIVVEKRDRPAAIKRLSKRLGIRRLAVEDTVQIGFYNEIKKCFIETKPTKAAIEKLRIIKDAGEIGSIRKAVKAAEAAFRKIRPHIRAGAGERAIALRLEEAMRKEGSEGLAFDIIVASGENSALPHARPTSRKLAKGDLVVVDWGARVGGYCSDMTRTLLLRGKDMARKKEIYSVVLRANRSAVGSARPGVKAASIDRAARDVVKKAGYGECFGHATGHGVGLDVHERPSVSWRSRDTVGEGMVFTVEPGIYVPGLGGVRIEDMVAVGAKAAHALTSLSRMLEVI